MKKLLITSLCLLLALPAHAEESAPAAAPEQPARPEQVKNLVKILLPEALYVDEKSKILTKMDAMLDEKFGCVKIDSPLQKKIHEKMEIIFSYEQAVENMLPLFAEFTEKDVLRVMDFYGSETGSKWSHANSLMPGRAKASGMEMGQKVVQEVMPLLAQDKSCAGKLMGDAAPAEGAKTDKETKGKNDE